MKCDIDNQTLLCRRCRCRVTHGNVMRNCVWEAPGLGDMTAAGLAAVGITKERVEAIVGGPCGCDERQEALNEFGRRFGIG